MPDLKKKPQTDWELKLQEEFPFMRRDMEPTEDESGRRWNSYQMFGCECGGGWYQLLHDLCQEITEQYAEANLPVDLVVEQVKEKFASLRFYYSFGEEPMAVHAFDSLAGGGVRFRPSAGGGDERRNQLRREIAAIVGKYEEKSEEVCEECGEPGTVRKDMPWKRTLCEGCYQNYLAIADKGKEKSPKDDFLE